VASEFPSTISAGGTIGVADVAFLNGKFYALVGGGGCSHGNPDNPSGIAEVNRGTGRWTMIADIGAWLKTHPAAYESSDDFEPDGTLYSIITVDDHLVAVEPNHGQVLSVTQDGTIRQIIDISASEGHIVPTSIAERGGSFYVGNLNLFPIDPQWARILTISKEASSNERWRLASNRTTAATTSWIRKPASRPWLPWTLDRKMDCSTSWNSRMPRDPVRRRARVKWYVY
jgi:hypothetical protein